MTFFARFSASLCFLDTGMTGSEIRGLMAFITASLRSPGICTSLNTPNIPPIAQSLKSADIWLGEMIFTFTAPSTDSMIDASVPLPAPSTE